MDIVQSKEINGSGVLLWELYKSRNGRVGLAVILFGSQRKSGFVYSDCGGGIDDGEAIYKGALRELQEESCNLFQFQNNYLTTYVKTKKYICYNVFISTSKGELRQHLFKENLNVVKNANCPYAWRESKTMRRFYIEDLVKQKILTSQNYTFSAVNTKGECVNIHSRCVGVIREVFKRNLVDLVKQTVAVPTIELSLKQYILPQGSRLTFLQGTKTFKVEKTHLEIESSIEHQKQVQQSLDPENKYFNNNSNNQSNNNQIQNNQQLQQQEIEMIEENSYYKPFSDVLQNYKVTNPNLIQKINEPKINRRGGGVIILATNELGEQGFLLVKDRKDVCSDMGGSSSTHEINIMEAGIRELKEETSNTFILSESHLNNVYSIRIQNYLCHAVHIERNIPQLQKVFENNVKALNNIGDSVPRCWKNKKEIIFFPISKNKQYFEQFDINSDDYHLVDSNNNVQTIRDRSAIIIHALITQKMHLSIPIQKVELEDNSENEFIYNDTFKFLTQTKSYVFQ